MRIAILGAGAMGILFGGCLSQENQTWLVDVNQERVKTITDKGVKIREMDGTDRLFYPGAVTDTADLPQMDLVIIFVKAMFTREALEANRNLIGPDTYLMTLQNGAGHEKQLLAFVDRSHVIIGSTQHNSSILADGYVNHGGGGRTAIGLLGATLGLGTAKFGAVNWISVGGLSFQPSEIAKICYIFAGSATLERLFRKRNLTLFIVLTGVCVGLLGLMSDFGTAAIFFVTFLVLAYLRSGDFATLSLICGGAVFGAGIIVKFKPYILDRFAAWGHAWADASGRGYQQTRTMSAAASGGLLGMGAGNGWLHRVPAADTDLVFGMLCEEWGLVIAFLAVGAIAALAFFTVRACRAGRSSFYCLAACAAGSLLVFQTCLNVFGSVDLLPLTGVTFPFVSNGGSAMMSAWGLLAFLKATDTREHASFAIRRQKLRSTPPGSAEHPFRSVSSASFKGGAGSPLSIPHPLRGDEGRGTRDGRRWMRDEGTGKGDFYEEN